MHTLTLKDRSFEGRAAPEWATAVAKFRNSWYWEESLEQADGKRFQSVGKDVTWVYDKDDVRGYTASYHLPPLQPQDDPLPPVPESVMYYNSTRSARNTQHLIVQPHWELEERLTVAVIKDGGHLFSSSEWGDTLSVNLDPDSALQLAHDIRRMAMQIKRNHKQEQAQ